MAVTFQFEILDPLLRRVHVLSEIQDWVFTRRVNTIGVGSMKVPITALNSRWLSKDYVIVPWQSIDGGTPRLLDSTAWLLTGYDDDLDSDMITLKMEDSNSLLRRRIIAYAAASAQASKTALADNLAKALVRENMGTLATDVARRFDSAYFTVQADTSLGASVTLAASREYVLPALQDIAKKSQQEGTFLAFDVVYTPGAGFDFRTYVGQRGVDRRSGVSKVLIGRQYGNLQGGRRSYDWSTEVNAAYAGGQGEESERLIGSAVDTQRATLTPWARVEGMANAYQAKTQAAVDAYAKRALREGQPDNKMIGNFIDTPALRLGLHVNFGDYVQVDVRGAPFDARLSSVQYAMQGGVYSATCAIEGEQTYG